MHGHNCFVISPIGDSGSATRKDADDLLQYLIIPALRNCGFSQQNIVRVDMLCTSGNINSDIITLVKSSDLCIIDVTGMNPNVMYECGMRHGNGKPYIMMVREGENLPFDISGIRTIHYDLSSLSTAKESLDKLEKFITVIVDGDFTNDNNDNMSTIMESLHSIERNIDILIKRCAKNDSHPIAKPSNKLDDILRQLSPGQALNYALVNQDVELIESLLPRLKQTMSQKDFIDYAITQSCNAGSQAAADYIKENWEYITTINIDVAYDCIASYVTYCNKKNIEEENIDFVNSCLEYIKENTSEAEMKGKIFNQWNRLFFGAYISSGRTNSDYLDQALQKCNMAIDFCPDEPSFFYNLATILQHIDINKAMQAIEKCLELDKKGDDDHLALAYELFAKGNSPKAHEVLNQLESRNPYLAYIKKLEVSRYSEKDL